MNGRLDRFAAIESHHENQFGGIQFGVGGLGIPILGTGGALPGGVIGGALGAPGGSIGPVITLQQAFGAEFTARSVSEAIRRAEAQGLIGPPEEPFGLGGPVIEIVTGPIGRLVINLAQGLFEILDPATGQKLGGGVTPEAAVDAVRAGGNIPAALGGGGGQQPPVFPRYTDRSHDACFCRTATATSAGPQPVQRDPSPDFNSPAVRGAS